MKHLLRFLFLCVAVLSCACVMAQGTLDWRDIYTVKKKDTVFGIASKYGLTLPELMEANPEMKLSGYTLKKGDTLFIPYRKGEQPKGKALGQTKAAEKKTNPVTAKAENPQNGVIRVGIMLPLHRQDGDGKRMVEYYRGFLMAVDDLKQEGISTDIHAWNVPETADVRQVLLNDGANQCDLIFGPLYTKQVAALGEFCKAYHIKLVIPFSINGNEVAVNPQVYQVYQSPEQLDQKAIQAFLNRFPEAHPVFVDCRDTTSRKGSFTAGLRKELEKRNIKYSLTSVATPEEGFALAFDRTKRNVVILNSGRSPQLNEVLAKLDALTVKYPATVISLYGYTEWLIYEPYDRDQFFRYDTYIPTTFYYQPSSEKTARLEKMYRQWFGTEMLSYGLPRFGITGYDQARFFLSGFHQYGRNFNGLRGQSTYQPVQSPLRFGRVGKGGYQNDSFELIHYTPQRSVESIAY